MTYFPTEFDMKNVAPLISVVMPAYNSSKYILDSVLSVLNQSVQEIELLVIDDCSEDDSRVLLSAIKDPRLSVLSTEKNSGPAKCRNIGFEASRGEFVALLDSDDIALPDRFKEQIGYMERNQNIFVCGGAMHRFGNAQGLFTCPEQHEDIKAKSLFNTPILNPAAMFRAAPIRDRHLRYNESLLRCSDYDFWLRTLSEHADLMFANLQKAVVLYRVHDSNVTNVKSESWLRMVSEIRRPHLEKLCGSVSEEDFNIHNKIQYVKFASNVMELRQMKQWLWRLREANEKQKLYDAVRFRFWLALKFSEICMASLDLGPGAIKQLITYPDFPSLKIESQTVSQLIKYSTELLRKTA